MRDREKAETWFKLAAFNYGRWVHLHNTPKARLKEPEGMREKLWQGLLEAGENYFKDHPTG